MGIFEKIRQHAAVATGNFASMFKEAEIPALPAATTRLVSEFNSPEPDIRLVSRIVSSDLDLSTRVIRTVNSSLYGLPNQVKSIQHAIVLLGLRRIRSMALSYKIKTVLPKPNIDLFDQEAFWTDSLVRALFARSLTHRYMPGDEDEAFTVMLLADVALPILLCLWKDYYALVVERWKNSSERLSQIERADFGWDHAQAGAWILKSWDFPDEITFLVRLHNYSIQEIQQLGFEKSIALPVVTASMLPSILRPCEEHSRLLIHTVCEIFSLSIKEFGDLIYEIQTNFNEISEAFDLKDRNSRIIEDITKLSNSQYPEDCT
jgi:HD-like signal output (HDOD) protein